MNSEEFMPWAPDRALHLRSVAAGLAEGLIEHAEKLAGFAGAGPVAEADWDAANQSLRLLLQSYGDALFDYTGSFDPVSNVYPEDGGLEYGVAFDEDLLKISILQRDDYCIVDGRAILEAGIEAATNDGHGDSPVGTKICSAIPDAIQAIAHASPYGWAALRHSPGIRPIASVILVKADPPLLDKELYGLPDNSSFDLSESPTVFSQVDQY